MSRIVTIEKINNGDILVAGQGNELVAGITNPDEFAEVLTEPVRTPGAKFWSKIQFRVEVWNVVTGERRLEEWSNNPRYKVRRASDKEAFILIDKFYATKH